MFFRPFLLLSDAALRKVQGKAEDIVVAWRGAWGIAPERLAVRCERAWESALRAGLADSAWHSPRRDSSCALRLSHGEGLAAALESLMFPPDADAGSDTPETSGQEVARELVKEITREVATFTRALAHEAVQAALADLQCRFAREFGNVDDAGTDYAVCDAPCFDARASGDVLVSVQAGAGRWHIWLAAGIVTAFINNAGAAEASGLAKVLALPDLIPALAASGCTAVQLPVMLGEVEIAVGNLLALATGDVIRLPRPINQPLDVLGPDGDVLFNGYLGQRGRTMVIEVVRPAVDPAAEAAPANSISRKGTRTS